MDVQEIASELSEDFEDAPSRWDTLVQRGKDFYFKPKPFEGRIYEMLGVRRFKRWAPIRGDKINSMLGVRSVRGRNCLDKFEKTTRNYELIGGVLSVALSTASVVCVINGHYGPALALKGLNLCGNGPNWMIQRYNRSRVFEIKEKFEEN